jgi:hypothetical protein
VRFCKRSGPGLPGRAPGASWGLPGLVGSICYSGPGGTGLVAPSVKTKTGTRALGQGHIPELF